MVAIPIFTTANRATSQRAVRGNVASGCDLLPTNFTENPRGHPLAGAWPHRSGLTGILGDLRVSGTSAVERTQGGAGSLGLTT